MNEGSLNGYVAVAQGKIIPDDRVKIIQPLEIGVVREVHVYEGKDVELGETLILLDLTNAKSDMDRVQKELLETRAAIIRLQILLDTVSQDNFNKRVLIKKVEQGSPAALLEINQIGEQIWSYSKVVYDQTGYSPISESAADTLYFPPEIPNDVVKLQERLFDEQLSAYQERMQSLNEVIQRKKWERISLEKRIKKLADTLPLITQRTNSFYLLSLEQYASRNRYLQLEQERLEAKNDLDIEIARRQEILVDITQAQLDLATLQSEFKRDRLSELVEAEAQHNALIMELTKAKRRHALTKLTSPIKGRIQELAIHTVGGVVTPAQELMKIVPVDDSLEVEVMLPNKDIGFIEIGQQVAIKLETFPFTKYGSIDGQITDISLDATADENLGLVYKVRADMFRSWIQVGKRRVNLTPGMAATLEAKTDERRLLEFFLAPLIRGFGESLRER
ncbi:MAG: HlyD family type I secretion periplasmic adaptor subunit [Magnetococcales bacterium]|nr:HlyD family type I secretion periplasmic adaptor subunit [Magnetococcales bacterium]